MKRFFQFFLIAFFSFAGVSMAEDKIASEQEKPIKVICQEQSQDNEYKYVPLNGIIIRAKKEFFPIDCFEEGCSDRFPASFIARVLKPDGEIIFVRTKSETAGEIRLKSYYMKEGKAYEFCARYIERPEGVVSTEEAFYIDDISTIKEIIQ